MFHIRHGCRLYHDAGSPNSIPQFLSMLLPLALTLAALTATAPKPDPKQHGWFTDYPAALAEAKKTGKPIFLVFRCEP